MSRDQTASSGPFRSTISALAPYNAGLSAEHVKSRYGVSEVAKLASNENPLGPSPAVSAAVLQAQASIATYPDPQCLALRGKIAEATHIAPDRLAFGNGSEDLLGVACRAFLDPGDEAIISSPTFSVCGDNATIMGARVIDVPRNPDMTLNVDAIVNAIGPKTKILYLCNPNNPTGTMIERAHFETLCRAMSPHGLIVADEAYFEYARHEDGYPDSLSFLPTVSAPWLVLRTFSKAYGLAGLRVGYGIASDARIARQIEMVRTAFNVNHLAQAAALAAWMDQEHVARSIAHNRAEKAFVEDALISRGFSPLASATNFLFFDTRQPSQLIAERLMVQGVIVKPWGGAFDTFIRVSIGTHEQNLQFLTALDKAQAGQ